MNWRDTIKAKSDGGKPLVASFRGARFIVPGSTGSFGRRGVVHEYPLRDKPWFEDLGRAARKFSVEGFVDSTLGDYLAARDALIAALEEPGSGTLVHPWYGTMVVALASPATVNESTAQGGRASFRLEFVEDGGLRFPQEVVDTAARVEDEADIALETSVEDFIAVYDTDGMPEWSLLEMADDLYASLAHVEELVTDVVNDISTLIRTPANMAAAIMGSISRLRNIVTEPLAALELYRRLFGIKDDGEVDTSTPTRKRQFINTAATKRLIRQAAVVEACRSASQTDFATRDNAMTTAKLLLAELDNLMEEVVDGRPVSDMVYQSLSTLRIAVARDMRSRAGRLPDLSSYTPVTTLPALVIAHKIYGDAARADEIIRRNHIVHPGFVRGGQPLEVLGV